MVRLLSVRNMFQPTAACILQGGAREGATTRRQQSTASERIVCIRGAYCPHTYASETMSSSVHTPSTSWVARRA